MPCSNYIRHQDIGFRELRFRSHNNGIIGYKRSTHHLSSIQRYRDRFSRRSGRPTNSNRRGNPHRSHPTPCWHPLSLAPHPPQILRQLLQLLPLPQHLPRYHRHTITLETDPSTQPHRKSERLQCRRGRPRRSNEPRKIQHRHISQRRRGQYFRRTPGRRRGGEPASSLAARTAGPSGGAGKPSGSRDECRGG